MTETVTKLKVEDADLKRVKEGADFLERAGTLAHGGLFLTTSGGENLFAELPASVLRLMRQVMLTMVESREAFLLCADEEVSPEKAAELLGISRPIVYQRMDLRKASVQAGRHAPADPGGRRRRAQALRRPSADFRRGDFRRHRRAGSAPCPVKSCPVKSGLFLTPTSYTRTISATSCCSWRLD